MWNLDMFSSDWLQGSPFNVRFLGKKSLKKDRKSLFVSQFFMLLKQKHVKVQIVILGILF